MVGLERITAPTLIALEIWHGTEGPVRFQDVFAGLETLMIVMIWRRKRAIIAADGRKNRIICSSVGASLRTGNTREQTNNDLFR